MSSLLPLNATALERAADQTGASATELPVMLRTLWNPETCPLNMLPWLAWAWSVDAWAEGWSERQKRDTVKQALPVQRVKGTIGAVRSALDALGIPVRVQEWFNQTPRGEPYTFRLLLDFDQQPLSQSGILKVLEVVDGTKNLRSHLEAVLQTITSRTSPNVAVVAAVGSDITLSTYQAPRLIINEFALPLDGTV